MILHVTAELGLTKISRDTETGAIVFTPSFGQAESYMLSASVDQIVALQGAFVNVECEFPVIAESCSRVFAFDGSCIFGQFGSEVIGENGSFIRAENGCFATAYDGCRVEALAGSHIKARFGSYVVVHEGALVDSFGGATLVDPSGESFALLSQVVPNRMMGR
jgi:hypothetical protein